MDILDINLKEVEETSNLVKNLDKTIPFKNYKKRDEKKTFSIISLINNKDIYLNYINTLRNQETEYTFELIPLFNFQNEFKSCSEALNFGMSLANSDYFILSHQDLLCPKNWIQGYKTRFDELEKEFPNKVGFIGMAGTSKYDNNRIPRESEYGAVYLSNSSKGFTNLDMSFADYFRNIWGPYKEVQCLDECVMVCKASLGIRFDPVNFDHYHFYGGDICMYALNKGLKNFAVDVDAVHLSNGMANLRVEEHRKAFIEYGSKLFKKWRDRTPYFRTTCAVFNGPEKTWVPEILLGLRREGIPIPSEFKVM